MIERERLAVLAVQLELRALQIVLPVGVVRLDERHCAAHPAVADGELLRNLYVRLGDLKRKLLIVQLVSVRCRCLLNVVAAPGEPCNVRRHAIIRHSISALAVLQRSRLKGTHSPLRIRTADFVSIYGCSIHLDLLRLRVNLYVSGCLFAENGKLCAAEPQRLIFIPLRNPDSARLLRIGQLFADHLAVLRVLGSVRCDVEGHAVLFNLILENVLVQLVPGLVLELVHLPDRRVTVRQLISLRRLRLEQRIMAEIEILDLQTSARAGAQIHLLPAPGAVLILSVQIEDRALQVIPCRRISFQKLERGPLLGICDADLYAVFIGGILLIDLKIMFACTELVSLRRTLLHEVVRAPFESFDHQLSLRICFQFRDGLRLRIGRAAGGILGIIRIGIDTVVLIRAGHIDKRIVRGSVQRKDSALQRLRAVVFSLILFSCVVVRVFLDQLHRTLQAHVLNVNFLYFLIDCEGNLPLNFAVSLRCSHFFISIVAVRKSERSDNTELVDLARAAVLDHLIGAVLLQLILVQLNDRTAEARIFRRPIRIFARHVVGIHLFDGDFSDVLLEINMAGV